MEVEETEETMPEEDAAISPSKEIAATKGARQLATEQHL